MKIQFRYKKDVTTYLPYITKGKNICAKCGRKTYRSQASVDICSYCEESVKITFEGAGVRTLEVSDD
jgi:predicted amidophosphoribosyltransferase